MNTLISGNQNVFAEKWPNPTDKSHCVSTKYGNKKYAQIKQISHNKEQTG
jgi:hypothetical protein